MNVVVVVVVGNLEFGVAESELKKKKSTWVTLELEVHSYVPTT